MFCEKYKKSNRSKTVPGTEVEGNKKKDPGQKVPGPLY